MSRYCKMPMQALFHRRIKLTTPHISRSLINELRRCEWLFQPLQRMKGMAGCYQCGHIFDVSEVAETCECGCGLPLCPSCLVDSVIPVQQLLWELGRVYCSEQSDLKLATELPGGEGDQSE